MLDILFALAVLAAVIIFGALISMGNERQRRAIDGLREQAAHWAEQDLRLKRARAAVDVRVPDARAWLAGMAARLLGTLPLLLSMDPWEGEGLKALVCSCQDGRKLVVTPATPEVFIRAVGHRAHSRLARFEVGLLGDRPRRVPVHEMNLITCGPFFDLEAGLAWQQVWGSPLDAERLYLFEVSPARSR
jgi:hypothetical protein